MGIFIWEWRRDSIIKNSVLRTCARWLIYSSVLKGKNLWETQNQKSNQKKLYTRCPSREKKKKKNKINRNHMAGHLLQLKALTLHTGHVLRHMETSPPSTVQGCPHAAGSPFSFPCRASLGNHYRGLPTQVLCEVLEKRHPAITLGPLRCGHACESGNPVHSWYEAPIPDVSGMNIIPQLFLISLQIEN